MEMILEVILKVITPSPSQNNSIGFCFEKRRAVRNCSMRLSWDIRRIGDFPWGKTTFPQEISAFSDSCTNLKFRADKISNPRRSSHLEELTL